MITKCFSHSMDECMRSFLPEDHSSQQSILTTLLIRVTTDRRLIHSKYDTSSKLVSRDQVSVTAFYHRCVNGGDTIKCHKIVDGFGE